jgi:formylglycine-generating enzyme required for sulfatase activity
MRRYLALLALSCTVLTLTSVGWAATYTVTTLADGGPGSLREAILNANANPGSDTIDFATGAGTISLNTELPTLTDDATEIQGDTGPITLSPATPPLWTCIQVQADQCVIRGLTIDGTVTDGFHRGIELSSTGGTTMGNQVGVAAAGQRNVIRNCTLGIRLEGVGVEQNLVHNNRTHMNSWYGISLVDGAANNDIGGTGSFEANTVTRSGQQGIFVAGAGTNHTHSNRIIGNYVGTTSAMAPGLGNTLDGIAVVGENCHQNEIAENLVVNNGEHGIHISAEAHDNEARTNLVGTTSAGAAMPNLSGIAVSFDAHANLVGPDNVVSGNTEHGVVLTDSAVDNEVFGNLIGLDPPGSVALPNGMHGVFVTNGAAPNTISDNTISGNTLDGVHVDGVTYPGVTIDSNRLGTDASGTMAVPNTHGVFITGLASDPWVIDNVISGNSVTGLTITPGSGSLFAMGNYVGVGEGGTPVLPNGIGMVIAGHQCTIGGTAAGEGNFIIGNVDEGVRSFSPGIYAAGGNTFQGNVIEDNGADGMFFGEGSFNSWVGAAASVTSDAGNRVRNNGGHGVRVGAPTGVFTPHGIRILTNSITGNAGDAIDLDTWSPSGNEGIPAPTITSADLTGASGVTGLGPLPTTIQLFVDPDDETETFVIEFDVPSGPGWSISTPLPAGAKLTATNTAVFPPTATYDHTSEVSAPYTLPSIPATILVPSGTFTMGDGTASCGVDERDVTLTNDFLLGQYEVTNLEYVAALRWAYLQGHVAIATSPLSVIDQLDGSTEVLVNLDSPDCEIGFAAPVFFVQQAASAPAPYDPEDHPVKEVSWFGAARYCDWLSMQAGMQRAYEHTGDWACNGGDPYGAEGYRLPTDAEWEYAAQWDDERIYPWGNDPPDCSLVNFYPAPSPPCVEWTAPVGSYAGAPTIEGEVLFDMAGNAFEWCNDWHVCDLGTTAETNPTGPVSGTQRVVRGGSWLSADIHIRNAYRRADQPVLTDERIGLRIARTAPTTDVSSERGLGVDRNRRLLVNALPNPFSAATQLTYLVPDGTSGSRVQLGIYDVTGRLVDNLVDGSQVPGQHTIAWSGDDASGRAVAAGVYFARIRVGEMSETRRIVLVR